jgi:2-oxo-4-hydroxy-4-carboxy--5-ureidoimidazoline (OHCU) decarboxylase
MQPHDMIQSLQQAIGHGGDQVFDVAPRVLRRVLEDRAWADRKDKDGEPFGSFEAFATHILWQGLESSISDLLLYCRKHPEVAELIRREVGAAAEHGTNQHTAGGVNNVNSKGGNNPAYALRRLKRDHPELAEKVVAGKLSAHAAAIEAGFRKRMLAVPADDPHAAITALFRHFGVDRVVEAANRVLDKKDAA